MSEMANYLCYVEDEHGYEDLQGILKNPPIGTFESPIVTTVTKTKDIVTWKEDSFDESLTVPQPLCAFELASESLTWIMARMCLTACNCDLRLFVSFQGGRRIL
jgi:hypothetical protein